MRQLYWIWALGFLSAAAPGCRPTAPRPVPPAVVKDLAVAAPDLQRDAAPAPDEPELPTSWSDPRILAQLARSCAFDPDALQGEERRRWMPELGAGDSSPLSCSGIFDQSCVYDPCFNADQETCRPRCVKACRDCGSACAAACETCKRPCQDDACRMACAKGCAACREGCVRTRDRCATGTCAEEYKACRKKLKADFLARGCPKLCTTYVACQERCFKKHGDDAYDVCEGICAPKDKRGCQLTFCGGPTGMGINPLEWP